jgi:hypothetical protein
MSEIAPRALLPCSHGLLCYLSFTGWRMDCRQIGQVHENILVSAVSRCGLLFFTCAVCRVAVVDGE